MTPELGHLALILAACLAAVQAVFPLVGAQRGWGAWIAVARPAALGQCLFLLMAFAALAHAFVVGDYSVVYVARNSNSLLPLQYRIAATWGAHEGSLLLWVTILGLWSAAVSLRSRALPPAFAARVLGVMGLVSFGFLAFLLITSNPFARVLPALEDGQDLNPLLQDIGLVMHPPILYTGYVGFAVAFGFAIASLLDGRFDAAWARWARPWTLVAWIFLTIGIALGSWWAYYELGWGGWWFWDPVENASFMPWLAGTALLHSLATSDKRGLFRSWTLLLAVTAFALSLLGTFLVRSGVLTSVHAFASDPARGIFILGLLALVIGGSLALYAWRAPKLGAVSTGFTPVSRESLLLANNVLLAAATASVLLGTVYPLLVEALGLGKISVGAPYFNSVFVPLALAIGMLMPLGSAARWKNDNAKRLGGQVKYAAAAACVIGLAFGFAVLRDSIWLSAVGTVVAAWIVVGTGMALAERAKASGWQSLSRSVWGMGVAHLGVAVAIVGVAVSASASLEVHRKLSVGESADVAGYRFTLSSVDEVTGPNYRALEGTVHVTRNGAPVATLSPQKRAYGVRGMAMTEAGIDPGITRDLYVSLGEQLEGGAWSARLYVKPFVRCIWLGALLMAAGGLIAVSDRRFRETRTVSRGRVAGPAAAGGVG